MTRARLVAAGLGSGFSPVAPGTVASAAALLAGAVLLQASPWLLAAAGLAATVAGFWAVPRAGVQGDPGWVVIDEFAGQWIALLGLSAPTVPGLAAAFLLFRVFDIAKPGPVGWADRRHGTFGVMMDDVIAGAMVALLLFAARWLWPNLGL